MASGHGMNLENGSIAELSAGPVVEAVLTAGAAIASGATTAALTGTVGTTTAAAASACTNSGANGGCGPDGLLPCAKEDRQQDSSMEDCPKQLLEAPLAGDPSAAAPPLVRWDAHLDNPNAQMDPRLQPLMQATLRGEHHLNNPAEMRLIETFEFISLGCYCAASYALQLLGLKHFSYPFDWVRSSLDGILHCFAAQFQDFLTYSQTWLQEQYMVFGGTRWGGSFWHHNLEAPVTREDMMRRVRRLYGQGEVPACKPRLFVRVVNSTCEIESALRLRRALRQVLPEAAEILLLLLVDMQGTSGGMAVLEEEGLLVYQIAESETSKAIAQGARGLKISSEGYAQAIAFAIRYWAGNPEAGASVRMFSDLGQLSASCEQWDGGDPSRELFTPRKFYGQQMDAFPGVPKLQKLCAPLQMFNFALQADINPKLPLNLECFGKYITVRLPEEACGGHVLQLYLNEGQLSGTCCLVLGDGQVVPVGPAVVEERLQGPATREKPLPGFP